MKKEMDVLTYLGTDTEGKKAFYKITSEELSLVKKVSDIIKESFIQVYDVDDHTEEELWEIEWSNTKTLARCLYSAGITYTRKGGSENFYLDSNGFRLEYRQYGFMVIDRKTHKCINEEEGYGDYGIDEVITLLKLATADKIIVSERADSVLIASGISGSDIKDWLNLHNFAASAEEYHADDEYYEAEISWEEEITPILENFVAGDIEEAAFKKAMYEYNDTDGFKKRLGKICANTPRRKMLDQLANIINIMDCTDDEGYQITVFEFPYETLRSVVANKNRVTWQYSSGDVIITRDGELHSLLWRILAAAEPKLIPVMWEVANANEGAPLFYSDRPLTKKDLYRNERIDFKKEYLDSPICDKKEFTEFCEDLIGWLKLDHPLMVDYECAVKNNLVRGSKIVVLNNQKNSWEVGYVKSTSYGTVVNLGNRTEKIKQGVKIRKL